MCFVGIDRTYPPENEADVEDGRQKFLQQRCSVDCMTFTDKGSACRQSVQFVPRSASERTRNAAGVDDSNKQLIRTTVLTEIVSRAANLVPLKNRTWNKGGWFYTYFCFMLLKLYSRRMIIVKTYLSLLEKSVQQLY